MSLRVDAIAAMEDGITGLGPRSEDAGRALDGLLQWLRDNAERFAGPNLAPADQVRVIADLLAYGGEETQ